MCKQPDTTNFINNGDVEIINPRLQNYVYQILSEYGEGDFLIRCYDFEKDSENKKRLLETKKKTFFSIYKVSRILIYHEIRRTQSYSLVYVYFDKAPFFLSLFTILNLIFSFSYKFYVKLFLQNNIR